MKTLNWSRWGLLSLCCAASAWGQEGGDPAELFDKLDADKDGQVTVEEIPDERPHFERLLRRGNMDENKSLSKDEWLAAHHPDDEPQPGPGPDGPGGRGGREGRPNPGQMFERLDVNKDGKLQKSEIPEQMPEQVRGMLNRVFEKAGKEEINREELMSVMGEMMRGRGRGPKEDGDRPHPEGPDGERRRPEGRHDGEGPPMRDGERGPGGPGRGDHGPGGLMGLLDQDQDGHLSRDEFSKAATYFGDLDRNRDGVLDPSELMGPRPERGPDHERPMGSEGRGPRGEFGPPGGPDGRPRREFDDRRLGEGPGPDGDRPRPEGRDSEDNRPGFGGPRPEGGPGGTGGRFNSEEFWKQLDKDGDGAVSKEEAPERMKERFEEIDADKNGKITQEEARTSMERRFGGRGPGGRGRPGGAGPDGPRPARPASEDSKPAEDKSAVEN